MEGSEDMDLRDGNDHDAQHARRGQMASRVEITEDAHACRGNRQACADVIWGRSGHWKFTADASLA